MNDASNTYNITNKEDKLRYDMIQIIKNLKKNGIEDITTEDVVLTRGDNKLKLRFFTEDSWMAETNRATTAQQVMGQSYKGYKLPLTIVEYEEVKYLVKKL